MIFPRLRVALALTACFLASLANGQSFLDSLTSNLNIEGVETTYDPETGLATAKGEVMVTYEGVEIRSGSASYNASTGEVVAREGVVIWKEGAFYRGENILYNVNTGELTGDAVRSSMPTETGTFFYQTQKFETATKFIERIEGGETSFTTHDLAKPNYRLRARSLTIYPGDRIVMRGVTVLAGDTPVFYLPYVSQPLTEEVGYRFTPGYQSRWGAFMLNQYGMLHGDHTLAKYRLDLRSNRGVGVGAEFLSLRHRANSDNFGRLTLYYLNDSDPLKNRTGIPRGPVSEDRYRINFQHRIYLPGPEKSTWYLDFDINKLSDAHFYEDFFFNDFRQTPEPENQISLVHTDETYVATLMTRFQANDFYTVGTKLPELALDFIRRPLWNTGLYHQGSFSAGILKDELGDEDERFLRDELSRVQSLAGDTRFLRARIDGAGFNRVHTYHELLYPKTLFGWLNLVPRMGLGFSHYAGIDGSPNDLDNVTRPIFHAGLDASFKLVKSWSDYQKPEWGLDGLRHVVQPYLNVSYLDSSQPQNFPSIDRLSPTTRPRSIDVPLFTAVDDLRSWNITRLGMRNLLQTRRDYTHEARGVFTSATNDSNQTYTWAGLNTYVDFFARDPEFNRDISNLYNELFFRPVPWLNFWMDMQLPILGDTGSFTELNQGITFMPAKSVQLTIGHQYVNENPYFRDSNLVFSRLYTRVTDTWGFAMNQIFEMDDGTMEFQSYSLTRDLTSWMVSVGGMVRDNRRGMNEYGLLLSLTLKDFPQVNLPLDIDPNPSGRGGSQ
jgi:hypothetical protein